MSLLPIIEAPDPRLKVISDKVSVVDDQLRRLADDMLETMYAAPGVGLAAIQVGVPKRLLVVDTARQGEAPDPRVFINPEIVWLSDEDNTYEEGCLSVPEHYAEVTRPAALRVSYLDRDGKASEVEADGLLATVLQHEMDHLDGILFLDHISAIKRNMILRKMVKAKKQKASESA
ncbi:peptide deformylase [Oceanibacterium hippocampi]|uniref:Peptide deformylase n=1 Tax=Oceanibacterium hippocampi TaxID=745714 RepID=A0A1Y5RXI4_9PROT|nr:Peptide deformylase [Oceanibacterium hippocampi]